MDYTKSNYNSYEEQKQYIEFIKNINQEYFEKNKRHKLFCVVTFGCQMNVRDSETLKGMLLDMGYMETDSEKSADIVIYNTCCIRENAENKVYGNLGILKSYKRKNKDLKIVLCGCMMQQDSVIENIKKSYAHVNVIFGTFNVQRFPELLKANIDTNELIIDVWDKHTEITEDLPAKRESEFKASVNIMYGCDNYCTYCVVPYVRGRERSRKTEDIINEIKSLVADGVIEIMLLGQNVNSYGKNLENPISFAELLREVNKIDGLQRIRFVTSHPKDISEELLIAMKECEKVCNHLHLPFQSGSNDILKAMNRRYTKEHYLDIVKKAKELLPNLGLTTDIIVGFPGETDEDFKDTLSVAEQCEFSAAYTFIYSKRTGTPAATMENQVSEEDVKVRFKELLNLVNDGFYEYNKSFIGKTVKVLVETVNEQNNELITGRTSENVLVHLLGDESLIGKIVDVNINGNKSFYMTGELVK